MIKETVICIIIVIAIIFGNNVTQNYTKDSVSELSSGLMSLRGKLTQNNIENEKVHNRMEKIYRTMARKA